MESCHELAISLQSPATHAATILSNETNSSSLPLLLKLAVTRGRKSPQPVSFSELNLIEFISAGGRSLQVHHTRGTFWWQLRSSACRRLLLPFRRLLSPKHQSAVLHLDITSSQRAAATFLSLASPVTRTFFSFFNEVKGQCPFLTSARLYTV